jgi:hypothetical protein
MDDVFSGYTTLFRTKVRTLHRHDETAVSIGNAARSHSSPDLNVVAV